MTRIPSTVSQLKKGDKFYFEGSAEKVYITTEDPKLINKMYSLAVDKEKFGLVKKGTVKIVIIT